MNKITNGIIKISIVGMTGICSAAFAVGTGLPFTVSETTVNLGLPAIASPNTFDVDSLDFSYKARIDQTNSHLLPVPGSLLNGDPFVQAGFLEASSYKMGTTTAASALNSLAAFGGYGLYGVFKLTGTAAVVGTEIVYAITSGTLSLYVDRNQNTTKVISGAINSPVVTLGKTTDDDLIGSASVVKTGSAAHLRNGLTNGDYEVIWTDFALTPFGSSYWIAPKTFHTQLSFDGNTTTIHPAASMTAPFTSTVDGSGNLFVIPEPTGLALMGIGLLGLGISRIRRGTHRQAEYLTKSME